MARRRGLKVIAGGVALGLIGALGAAAWVWQLQRGLIVTGMSNGFSWGLYISTMAFFVGNAAGGMVLSASIHLLGLKHMKPLARLGVLSALANVIAAVAMVLVDMGQPQRVLNTLLHPNFRSPLIWDVIALTGYGALCVVYLYVLMLPDLPGRWTRAVVRGRDASELAARWSKALSPFALVLAVSIHVVTAMIFSTQGSRHWWHTAALAPDFVAVAVTAGTAVVLIAAVLARGAGAEVQPSYRTMAAFIAVGFVLHLFFMYGDMAIVAWYGDEHALRALEVTVGRYLALHLVEVLVPAAAVLALLSARVRRNAAASVGAAAALLLGVFAHRYLIMPAAFEPTPLALEPLGASEIWTVPIATGRYVPGAGMEAFATTASYAPTAVEAAITVGVVALAGLMMVLGSALLPVNAPAFAPAAAAGPEPERGEAADA